MFDAGSGRKTAREAAELSLPCSHLCLYDSRSAAQGTVSLLPEFAGMQEYVVENAGRDQAGFTLGRIFRRFVRLFGPDDPPLTQDGAVRLAGDFFGHIKDHLHHGVFRQRLRTAKKHPGLAQVVDRAAMPLPQALHSIAQGQVELEPSGAGNPRRCPDPGAGTTFFLLRGLRFAAVDTLGAPHGLPVVLILGGTKQAHLIVVAVPRPAGPGKFVRAAPQHKDFQHLLRHLVVTAGDAELQSSTEVPNLGRLLLYKARKGMAFQSLDGSPSAGSKARALS